MWKTELPNVFPYPEVRDATQLKVQGEKIFKIVQFIRNNPQQHLKDVHPLKRESRIFC